MPWLTSVATYWRNTRQMPSLLRMLCQGFMIVSPLMVLLITLPIGSWNVNGMELTFSQFWRSGFAPALMTGFVLMTIGSWGAAARNQNSRWAVVFSGFAPFIILLVVDPQLAASAAIDWFDLVGSAVMSVLIYLFLFKLPSVTRFYAFPKDNAESA